MFPIPNLNWCQTLLLYPRRILTVLLEKWSAMDPINIPQSMVSINMGMSENEVYPQWNSHLIGIMIRQTIGCRGFLYFQTNPYSSTSRILFWIWLQRSDDPASSTWLPKGFSLSTPMQRRRRGTRLKPGLIRARGIRGLASVSEFICQ